MYGITLRISRGLCDGLLLLLVAAFADAVKAATPCESACAGSTGSRHYNIYHDNEGNTRATLLYGPGGIGGTCVVNSWAKTVASGWKCSSTLPACASGETQLSAYKFDAGIVYATSVIPIFEAGQTNCHDVVWTTERTNYTHCVNWTNNTGAVKPGALLNPDGSLEALVTIQPGSWFSRCWTNGIAGLGYLYIRPYQGAPLDEYVSPDDQVSTTTPWTQPISQPVPGGGLNTGGTGSSPIVGSNAPNGNTNLVGYYSPVGTGVTNGATSRDINQLGNALISSLGSGLDDVEAAVERARVAIVGAINNSTNFMGGGGAGVSDSNWIAATTAAVTNWGAQNYRATTNVQAAIQGLTNGIGSDMFNTTAAWYTTGYTLDDNANSGWKASLQNTVKWGQTNTPTKGAETPLRVVIGTGDWPGMSLAVLDLRPSEWPDGVEGLLAAGRAVVNLFFLGVLYWALWTYFEQKFDFLQLVTGQAGKALTGTTVGGVLTQPLRLVVATFITVGIAALPSALVGVMDSLGIDDVLDNSFLTWAVSAAGLDSGIVGALWTWFDAIVPWVTMTTCIVNYLTLRVTAVGIQTLWLSIYRFLPVVIFFAAMSANADQWIIDNRLHAPVGAIVGNEVNRFPVGETRVDMPANFTLSYAAQATNGLAVSSVAGSEWTRLIVRESATNENTLMWETVGEHGWRWGFGYGMGFGGAILAVVAAVWVAKKVLSLPFGRISE